MTTLPKMTQEDKDGLIALHMAMRTVDRIRLIQLWFNLWEVLA